MGNGKINLDGTFGAVLIGVVLFIGPWTIPGGSFLGNIAISIVGLLLILLGVKR